jgi:exopolysaccharide production protein ExoQ
MKPFTANKPAYSSSGVQRQPRQFLLSLAFIVFLFVIFVGLTPFAEHTEIDDLAETGEGDIVRQLIFIGLALLVSYLLFLSRKNSLRALRRLIPSPILLVLAWCALTLLWSPVPLIGLRRLGLTALLIFTTFAFLQGLGPWRALQLLAFSLAAFVIASLISGPLVPAAVHLSGERDASIVGAWRGIFFHKNHAGMTAAISIIVSLYLWRVERRKVWLLAVIAGAALLFLSKSKTSLGLLIPSIIVGFYFEQYKKSGSNKRLLILLPYFLLVFSAIALLPLNDQIGEIFEDPDAFTGRVAIWGVLIMVIEDYFIEGVGFNSLYQVGEDTPFLNYASGWVSVLPHGHNGYLDILATTGIIGFSFFMFAFLIRPLHQISHSRHIHPKFAALLFSIISFVILHNFLESSLLNKERALWITLLIVCAIAQNITYKAKNIEI